MEAQTAIWAISLTGITVVTLAFLYVVIQAGKTADTAQVQRTSNVIRTWWF